MSGITARGWTRGAIGALVLLVVMGAIVAGIASWAFLRPLPSDARLIARFRERQADFETLAATALADSDFVSAFRDPSRRSRYRQLLRRADVPEIRRSPDGSVWLRVARNYDLRKGYVYSTRPLAPIRPSLDSQERAVGSGYLRAAFLPLTPRWYLFIEARE